MKHVEKNDPKEIERLKKLSAHRRPCSAPFKTPVIMHDGTITVCCFDGMMNLNIGNLKENKFKDLWYGKKMDEFRLIHIRGEFDKIENKHGFKKCLYCRGYDTPEVTDEEIVHYLKYIKKEEEIEPYLQRVKQKDFKEEDSS